MLNQKPRVIWITGLPQSGKTTLAKTLDSQLMQSGFHSFVLDGDDMRAGLCEGLGFSDADRLENNRRIAHTARLMCEAGLIVIVATVLPLRSMRELAQRIVTPFDFRLVYMTTPPAVCEERDTKGHYAAARRGDLTNFTGYDGPFYVPTDSEGRPNALYINHKHTPLEAASIVLRDSEFI